MRKIIAYIAVSLDGYIADKNKSVAWICGDDSEKENLGSYPKFIKTVDTVILGYTTYSQIVNKLSPSVWPYDKMDSYVLTHRKLENKKNIIFTNENITALAKSLKNNEGKNIWICGGASILNNFHRLNLIDEYIISIIPTILGNGIPLFEKQNFEQKLKLLSTNSYNGIVDLKYKKRN